MLNRVLKYILYFTLILSILVPVLNLTSCDKDREYDEAEVKAEAKRLLCESEKLNLILYGKGIGYVYGAHQSGAYYEADFLHLNALGFTTVGELKEMVKKTFTTSYSENIFSTVLSSISDGGYAVATARYYQLYDDQVNKIDPICIMVNKDYDYFFKDTVVYDYSTVTVKDVEGDTLRIGVSATVTDGEGNSQTREIVFELIEESEGWRINSPTFANYNPSLNQ